MKFKTTFLAAAAVALVAPAANANQGLYGAIGAGLNLMKADRELSNDGTNGAGPFIFDSTSDSDNGVGVYTALGYDWGNSWRTEFEFAHRSNDIRHITSVPPGFSGWPEGTISGDTKARSFLVNFIYDMGNSSGGGVTPFFGGGVGLARVSPSITGSNPAGAPVSPLTIAYGNRKTGLAYQGIAGLAFHLAENVALDVSYRYFATNKLNFAGTLNGAPAAFDAAYSTHNLMAGLRVSFGGAAAPAVQYKDCWDGSSVPLTSQCPPQLVEDADVDLDPVNLTVYFDYDKASLTSQASALIREAAARALENDIENVVVSGNTDTSGSSAYNQALSERRARVVRDALIAYDVPADRIRMDAFGENNLATPTPDGTREPLNRRTDVTISFH